MDDKDPFWELFAYPPSYDLSPWKGMGHEDRSHFMLTLNWIIHSQAILLDLYSAINESSGPFSYTPVLSGEHAIGFHLRNALAFPRPLPYKTIEICLDFSSKFKPESPLSRKQVEILLASPEVNVDSCCNGFFAKNPTFFEEVYKCSAFGQQLSQSLLLIAEKHQELVQSKLSLMQQKIIRLTVVKDTDIFQLPIKKVQYRVGFEIYQESSKSVFFWSLFTVRVDWMGALLGKSVPTEKVTVINMLPPSDDIPINLLMIQNLFVASFAHVQEQLRNYKKQPKLPDRHYHSLFSNPNADFLRRRHRQLAQLFDWCKKLESAIEIEDLEDCLERVRERKQEGESPSKKERLGRSDFWYLEFKGCYFNEKSGMVEIRDTGSETDISFSEFDDSQLVRDPGAVASRRITEKKPKVEMQELPIEGEGARETVDEKTLVLDEIDKLLPSEKVDERLLLVKEPREEVLSVRSSSVKREAALKKSMKSLKSASETSVVDDKSIKGSQGKTSRRSQIVEVVDDPNEATEARSSRSLRNSELAAKPVKKQNLFVAKVKAKFVQALTYFEQVLFRLQNSRLYLRFMSLFQ